MCDMYQQSFKSFFKYFLICT